MSKKGSPTAISDGKKLDHTKGSGGLISWLNEMVILLATIPHAGQEFLDKTDRSPPKPNINKMFEFPSTDSTPPPLEIDVAASTPAKTRSKSTPKKSKTPKSVESFFEFERDDDGALTSAGRKAWMKATTAHQEKVEDLEEHRSECVAFVISCLSAATVVAIKNVPAIASVLAQSDVIGLRAIIDSVCMPLNSLRPVDSLHSLMNLKHDASKGVESFIHDFTQCSEDVRTIFSTVENPGYIALEPLLVAVLLNSVSKEFKPWLDQIATHTTNLNELTVLGLQDSMRQHAARELAFTKRHGGPAGKSDTSAAAAAKAAAKANRAAAGTALATPGSASTRGPKYETADESMLTKEHPYRRVRGNHTGPAKLTDPSVTTYGCCAHCWANGWIITNHGTNNCHDLIWLCKQLGTPAPTASTHPNHRPAAIAPATPAAAVPAPAAAAVAPAAPISAVNTVSPSGAAAQAASANALLSSLSNSNRFHALAAVENGGSEGSSPK